MQRQTGQIVRNSEKTDRKDAIRKYEICTAKTESSPRANDFDHRYLSDLLRQGTKFILSRYEQDLRKLEEILDGKEQCELPQFQSDSRESFKRLAIKINNALAKPKEAPIESEVSTIVRKQHTLLLKELQKMAEKTHSITIQLSNSLALNGLLTQTVHRLQISQSHDLRVSSFYKSFVVAFSTYCQAANHTNKFRKAVTAIQFSKRLKKLCDSHRRQRQNSGWISKLQNLENAQLMRKIKRSLYIPEVYSPTGEVIRKMLKKLTIQDSLIKLIDSRSVNSATIKYPVVLAKVNGMMENRKLEEELLRLNVRVKTIYQNIV